MPATFLALLRGINLAGKNRLTMKDLAAMFVDAGCVDVRTYIQSGNVIFNAPARVVAGLPVRISADIEERFGLRVPLVLRTAAQIDATLRGNPFLKAGAAEGELHVLFLAEKPVSRRIQDLDPDRSRPDEFQVLGQEIYLRLPNGVGRTKLSNQYFDSRLAAISTGRNWRTVSKLLELMKG